MFSFTIVILDQPRHHYNNHLNHNANHATITTTLTTAPTMPPSQQTTPSSPPPPQRQPQLQQPPNHLLRYANCRSPSPHTKLQPSPLMEAIPVGQKEPGIPRTREGNQRNSNRRADFPTCFSHAPIGEIVRHWSVRGVRRWKWVTPPFWKLPAGAGSGAER